MTSTKPLAAQLSQDSASLVKRLAGPSAGKAGLALDQTEINRIIAEASKGSKFYENEKKKDKDLTRRIERILKQRDEVVKGVDLTKLEAAMDNLLVELESQRDLTQTIVHVDMDAFFASVELLDNPDLKGKPFGVGKGVLTTASYEARKFGVRSGMAGFIAKKLCPDLILLPIHHSRYGEMSGKVMDVFRRYDPAMSPAGCDETYLNITAYCQDHKITPEECVQEMRRVIHEETKLTASAGIAPNKMLAKNKPNGQYHLPFERKAIVDFMHDLSIRKIPGIGRVNERLLDSIGIKTCGDIYTYRATLSLLDKQFGLNFLLRTYLGIASNLVQAWERSDRKSIGAERTFNTLKDKDRILGKLDEVAHELEEDMLQGGWTGKTITLKYKLDSYQVFTRAKSFDQWITSKEDLYATGKELLLPELPLKLRLIGLRVTKLKDLKAPEATGGIKRFFEPVGNDLPNKRRKIEEEEGGEEGFGMYDTDEEYLREVSDEDDDAMMDLDGLPSLSDITKEPPIGDNAATISNATATSSTSKYPPKTKPASTRVAVPPPKPPKLAQQHVCPVCNKTLETDNDGLNEHVDFCLSRGAIMEAQTEARSPVKASGGDVVRAKATVKQPKSTKGVGFNWGKSKDTKK